MYHLDGLSHRLSHDGLVRVLVDRRERLAIDATARSDDRALVRMRPGPVLHHQVSTEYVARLPLLDQLAHSGQQSQDLLLERNHLLDARRLLSDVRGEQFSSPSGRFSSSRKSNLIIHLITIVIMSLDTSSMLSERT